MVHSVDLVCKLGLFHDLLRRQWFVLCSHHNRLVRLLTGPLDVIGLNEDHRIFLAFPTAHTVIAVSERIFRHEISVFQVASDSLLDHVTQY